MSQTVKFLCWNVENFHSDHNRVSAVVDTIAQQSPDVFALFEVKGRQVFWDMINQMPNYQFKITESESVPEILIGIKSNFSSFVTQKNELNSKVPSLRPGALATLHINEKLLSFLFLHLKSFPEPRSWGLRDDMFGHVTSLKRTLDREMQNGLVSNFIALGDLNTMGMAAKYNDELDIDGPQELSFVDQRMQHRNNGMVRLSKTHDETWWNGKDNWSPSDLDHVYAANHLDFNDQTGGAKIGVKGWVEESTVTKRKNWINRMSDHCMLVGEVKLNSLN